MCSPAKRQAWSIHKDGTKRCKEGGRSPWTAELEGEGSTGIINKILDGNAEGVWLDMFLVLQMICDVELPVFSLLPMNTSFLRLVRILRILRLTRVVRFVPELRTIVVAMMFAIRSVFWAVCLIMLIIYVVAICIAQAAIDATKNVPSDAPDMEDLEYWLHCPGPA